MALDVVAKRTNYHNGIKLLEEAMYVHFITCHYINIMFPITELKTFILF